ncbi:MAG TPA: DUF1800 domain-containing protein [Burkholderiaceae bacterium]|nr:DUF1800 domain-containing protein [Burkholderiaceae bacterium]
MIGERCFAVGWCLVVVFLLAACGGGEKVNSTTDAVPTSQATIPDDAGAVRFMAQASFGATAADIALLKTIGLENWIDRQFALSRAATGTHLEYVRSQIPLPVPAGAQVTMDPLYHSFWRQAMLAPDQLRQRVAFALSQILVISAADDALAQSPHTVASFLDVLADNAFGNYRDILQAVSTHPAMGQYLTSLANRGDNGRTPDENFAREVMQLFTIGLFELNVDGTLRLVDGAPVDTYDMDDIRGLAKVFTGWSWGNEGAPDPTNGRFFGNPADPMRRVIPMQFYRQYHSPDAKTFLSVTIPAGTDGQQALRTALDTLFNHPNVPPFIGKQLIQRMVTSNPSPQYVRRVAEAFASGRYRTASGNYTVGSGARGDMKATVAAVLLDPEARTPNASPDWGKLREPVLRLAALMRAFEATSQSPGQQFRIGNIDNQFAQTPMRAPSVFNFYRPGYVPPNTTLTSKNLVAPEFQIANEVTVATYANTLQNWIANGFGSTAPGQSGPDIRIAATTARGLATDVDRLVDHVNLMLTYNSLAAETRAAIRAAVSSIPATANNAAANRVNLALFLTMLAPEFLVQK